MDDPAPVQSLVFVTWNTHVGGGDLDAFVRALRDGDLTGGAAVRHFVLLLQEVYRDGPEVPGQARRSDAAGRIAASPPAGDRADIIEVAQRLGLALLYVPSMRNGTSEGQTNEDRGNAILSSVPLSDPVAIELPFEKQRRVAAAATVSAIDASGQPRRLRVASSHLNATAGIGRLFVFASGVRAAQARSLATALDGADPAILGSDLNTWAEGPREPAVAELVRVFSDTVVPRAEATFNLGWQLDYLFFRLPDGWNGVSSRVASRFGSDHHPLLGRLRID